MSVGMLRAWELGLHLSDSAYVTKARRSKNGGTLHSFHLRGDYGRCIGARHRAPPRQRPAAVELGRCGGVSRLRR